MVQDDRFTLVGRHMARDLPVREYISKRTGFRIVLADAHSPMVNGFFTILTEESSDDGLPHTLEHLIFLGSKSYPYKGVLDAVANRCLAQGTNAWTAVDHTTYTATTVGSEGFLNLLPIYLDHILRPIIDDRAFLTEVSHVGGDGKWGGVVYSEMQSHEHTCDNISLRTLYRLLYPNHGYSFETGGMLANLRELNVDKVRSYHKKFYRWDNMCLTVTGSVDDAHVLSSIAQLEDLHESEGDLILPMIAPHPEPFSSALPPLAGGSTIEIPFPSDDESLGSVTLGWRGPRNDLVKDLTALEILADYLSSSNEAPLVKELVENKQLCGAVSIDIDKFKECAVILACEDVPTEAIDQVGEAAMQVLIHHRNNEGFDLDRIRSVARREKLRSIRSIEIDPHEDLADYVNSSFISWAATKAETGRSFGDILSSKLAFEQNFDDLISGPVEFWNNLFDRIFKVDQPNMRVEVRCRPSKLYSDQVQADDVALVAATRTQMGDDGLRRQGEFIDNIKYELSLPPPASIIDAVPAADISKVPLLDVHASPTCTVANENSPSVMTLKYPSAFVKTSLLLRLPHDLPMEDLSYLELLTSSLFECDLFASPSTSQNNDTNNDNNCSIIPYTEVTRDLIASTSSFSCGIGLEARDFQPGAIPQVMVIEFTSPAPSFAEEGNATWIKGLRTVAACVQRVKFTSDRIAKVVQQDLSFAKQSRRNGSTLLNALDVHLRRGANHPGSVCGVIRQIKALTKAKSDPESTALHLQNLMQKILFYNGLGGAADSNGKKALARPVVALSGAVEDEEAFLLALAANYCVSHSSVSPHDAANVRTALNLTTTAPWSSIKSSAEFDPLIPEGVAIAGSGAIQSGYCLVASKTANPSKYTFGGEDEAAAHVLCELLSVMEGPMYKAVRGAGFAYGCDFYCRHEVGEFALSVQPASDVVKGMSAALKVLKDFVNDQSENDDVHSMLLSPSALVTAKSSASFGVARREETYPEAAHSHLIHSLRGLPLDFNSKALESIQRVTVEDVARIMKDSVSAFNSCKSSSQGEEDKRMLTLTILVPEKQLNTVKGKLDSHDWLSDRKVSCFSSKELTALLCNEDVDEVGEEAEEEEDEGDDEDGIEEEDDSQEGESDSSPASASKKRRFTDE